VEVSLGTKSLEYLSVAEQGLVTPCVLVIQMLLAVLWRLETTTCIKWVAAGVFVAGGVFDTFENLNTGEKTKKGHWLGFIYIFASFLVQAFRQALTQHIFQNFVRSESAFKQRSKFQLLPYVSIGTFLTSFLIAGIFDPQAYEKILEDHMIESIALPVVVTSLCIVTLTICEYLILSITAATVLSVLFSIHSLFIALSGILVNHDQVARNQWIGFGICGLGSAIYFYACSQQEDGVLQDVSAGSIILSQSMDHNG